MASSVLEFSGDDPPSRSLLHVLYHAAPPSDRPATLRYQVRSVPGGYRALAPGAPPYGPASLEAAFAFLEWRATEDVLAAERGDVFLHAAGISVGGCNLLLVGGPGSGKSTLATHLLVRGHHAWGDDLVRFARDTAVFSAMPRSWKLDAKTLRDLPLVAKLIAAKAWGTAVATLSRT